MNEARDRGERAARYAQSLPDDWLPGELEEHQRRIAEEPGYAEQPVYIRPDEFVGLLPEFPDFPEYPGG